MDFNDAVKEFGKSNALRVIFGDLNGINFNEVEIVDYQSIYKLIDKFESHSDKWVFTNDNSISLFFISSITSINNKLKQLKLLNQLKLNEDWYYGNGFRINQSQITKDLAALRVTSSDILLSSLPDNSAGQKQNNGLNLKWIKGVYGIINAKSIPADKKKISNYSNEALWFDGKPEHIIIHGLDTSQAYELIDQIIEVNGGEQVFKKIDSLSESQKEWEIIYEGRDFLIGYLPKEGLVRINRFSTIITEGDSPSNFDIHSLSSNISSIVNGIQENVYTSNNPELDSPPFYALSDEASEVLVNSNNKEDVISKFQKIVLKNAPEDEFLKLSPESVIHWLSQKSSRKISFDVTDRFSSELKSKNDLLHLSIKELPLNAVGWKKKITSKSKGDNPKVLFSEPFKTRRILASHTSQTKNPLLDDSNKIDEKVKSEFLKSQVQEETIEEITPKRRKSNFWRWVFIILGLICLILLFRKCKNSDHPEYYFDRGVSKYESREYEKAISDFDKSIDVDPNYFNAYWYRSLAHFDQNNYQDALFDIEKAISLDNNNWEFYHLRGRIKMNMANSKYSRKYKEALDDFSKSLSLNDGEENAKSYYYRGRTHELLEDSMECPDYYLACEYSFEDACSVVDKLCYPETGFMPYNEFFGPGVKMGDKKFEVDNSNGTVDAVVALINNRTGRRIRAQFVRAGQVLIMDGIPIGSYKLQIYEGNYWSNSLILKDGISKGGFLANAEFKEVEFVWDFERETDTRGVILNSSEGDLNSRNINDAEFFN